MLIFWKCCNSITVSCLSRGQVLQKENEKYLQKTDMNKTTPLKAQYE